MKNKHHLTWGKRLAKKDKKIHPLYLVKLELTNKLVSGSINLFLFFFLAFRNDAVFKVAYSMNVLAQVCGKINFSIVSFNLHTCFERHAFLVYLHLLTLHRSYSTCRILVVPNGRKNIVSHKLSFTSLAAIAKLLDAD